MEEKEESWFEICTECGGDTFKIKVIPFGECGTDNQFICANCNTWEKGIYNDPLGEGDYDQWEEIDQGGLDTAPSGPVET